VPGSTGLELDVATVPLLAGLLREHTRPEPAHLVVDLTGVRFLASAGVGLILSAMHNDEGIHGRLASPHIGIAPQLAAALIDFYRDAKPKPVIGTMGQAVVALIPADKTDGVSPPNQSPCFSSKLDALAVLSFDGLSAMHRHHSRTWNQNSV